MESAASDKGRGKVKLTFQAVKDSSVRLQGERRVINQTDCQ